MTLKELCSQFMHDATLKIIDATSCGKDITDIVRNNKDKFQDIEVEDISIQGSYIQIIISSGVLASMIKAVESYKVLRDYCTSKPSTNDCRECIFRDKNSSIYDGSKQCCILANNIPQFWDYLEN